MKIGQLEHLNVTVSDAHKTANLLCKLFDWKVRWSGPAIDGGTTYHVGTDDAYLAIYMPPKPKEKGPRDYSVKGALNHVGVVVSDIALMERRVENAGLKPHSHGDYEPGRRFYFEDEDGIEYEVVSYS